MQRRTDWYAVQVRANREDHARALMESRGYITFLPTYVSVRQWSDRRKRLARPLFPGYVFCQAANWERSELVKLSPVIRIVGSAGVPQAVDASEFAALESVVRADLPRVPCETFAVGQRVLVVDGPMAGYHGLLDETRGRHRFVVSLTLIERSVAVEVPASSLLPLESARSQVGRQAAA